MGAKINVIGQRYGRLIVEADAGTRKPGETLVVVLCDCGTRKTTALRNIRTGKVTSCGCRKHKMSGTSTYGTWSCILSRCTNEKNSAYKDYGGRGITVCERWRTSFENFLEDMGVCPDGMSIDREDNNLGYGPGNCRWASKKEQARNRRNNLILEYQGITASLAEHCERLGLTYSTVFSRLNRGWDAEKALSKPSRASQVSATELRADLPASLELRRIAAALIGAGVADEREGL